MVAGSDQHAPLPPHYAFVVQLAADTQVETGQIHARVEHVVSRHTTPFALAGDPARVHGPDTPRRRSARAGGRGRDATNAARRQRTA